MADSRNHESASTLAAREPHGGPDEATRLVRAPRGDARSTDTQPRDDAQPPKRELNMPRLSRTRLRNQARRRKRLAARRHSRREQRQARKKGSGRRFIANRVIASSLT